MTAIDVSNKVFSTRLLLFDSDLQHNSEELSTSADGSSDSLPCEMQYM